MKFSIIIPTYNRANFLSKAINSILEQTYQDWELIIVDDGSTDNTKELVSQYQDERIKYIYQNNAERSAARNNGIKHATGNIICFMDSDNYYLSERLENLKTSIEKSEYKTAMFYSDIIYHYSDTDIKKQKKGRHFAFPIDHDALMTDVIATPQVFISQEILRKYTFNEKFNVGEDMELWFRIAEEYPIVYIEEQATVIETEHEGRSVNYNSFSNVRQIDTFKFMFSAGHPANKVSQKLKRKKLEEAFLRACYYYSIKKQTTKAIKSLMASFYYAPINTKSKFKANLFFLLITGNFDKIEQII